MMKLLFILLSLIVYGDFFLVLGKEIVLLEPRVLALEQQQQAYKQEQGDGGKYRELLVVLGIAHCCQIALGQLIERFLQGRDGIGCRARDIDTLAGLGNLLSHLLVEVGSHGIAAVVGQVTTFHGDRSTVCGAHADDIDLYAQLGGLLGGTDGVVLKVLTIGDDDDGFLRLLALRV